MDNVMMWIVVGWTGEETVVCMYIELEYDAARRRLDDLVGSKPLGVEKITLEGPWGVGEDISSENRIFETVYMD